MNKEIITPFEIEVSAVLEHWKRNPALEYDARLMDSLFDEIAKAGIAASLKVKAQAFKKENTVTIFPAGMREYGKTEEDGGMVFDTSNQLTFSATKMGEPYVMVYAGSCGLSAYFYPSDVESIKLHQN